MSWLALLAPLGGLVWRIKGGLGGDVIRAAAPLWGTTAMRIGASLITAAWAAAVAGDVRVAAIAPALLIGMVLGWWHAADMGRDGDRPRLVEGLIMTGRGLIMTAPAGGVLWWLGYGWGFVLAGLALGLLYELGHRTPTLAPGFERGMPMADVYTGTWIWAALAGAVALPAA
jgi:hypothetical protein